jgi:autotransporter-associated beta strand protein
VAASLLLLAGGAVRAASDSWKANAAGNWNVAANWTGNQVPGSTTTDNSDVATFSFTLATSGKTVTVDNPRYIGGISFGNTSAFGYTLATGQLRLNDGGIIKTLATSGAHAETISTPITLSGSATFDCSGPAAGSGLMTISGGMTGTATTGNTNAATLTGTGTSTAVVPTGTGGLISTANGLKDGAAGGVLAVVKDGSGMWTINVLGTYTGGTWIKNGTLQHKSPAGSLGTGPITLGGTGSSGATYMSGQDPTVPSITSITPSLGGTNVITPNGPGNGLTVTAPIILNGDLMAQTFTNNVGQVSPLTLNGNISGTGNLILNAQGFGANLLTVGAGGLAFTGNIIAQGASTAKTTISGMGANIGKLTGNSATAPLWLNSNPSFVGSVAIGAGTLVLADLFSLSSASSITMSNGTTLSLPIIPSTVPNLTFVNTGTINFTNAGGSIYALTVSATDGVTNSGAANSVTLSIVGPTLANGTYTLINYSGSLKGSGFSGFKAGTSPSGKAYSLQDSGSAVQLVVADAAYVWTGTQSTEWSTATIAGSKNWALNGSPIDYVNSTNTYFDDTATGYTVDISVADVTPTAVAFNNSTAYLIQGSKAIAGSTALIKTGSGTVTIENTNTFTGLTTIGGGTLQLNGDGTIASSVVTNNANLLFTRTGSNSFSGSIRGSGFVNKTGAGIQTLAGTNSYTGSTTIHGGTLRLEGSISSPGSGVQPNNDAVLYETSSGSLGAQNLIINSTSTSTLLGSNSIANQINITTNGTLQINGPISSAGGTISQGGTVIFGLNGPDYTFSSAGNFNIGGNIAALPTAAGTGYQTNGTVLMVGATALNISVGGTGTYNLIGGTITNTGTSLNTGIRICPNFIGNGGADGTFNQIGGTINFPLGGLMIGRSDTDGPVFPAGQVAKATFNQTGGTTFVNSLSIGGYSVGGDNRTAGVLATNNTTGGSFTAANFVRLANGTNDVVVMNLGGSAQVTLGAFPALRGTDATAEMTLDFTSGYLAPFAASTSYLPAGTFDNAYLTANGAKINVGISNDIAIAQVLKNAPSQTGTLTKTGNGTLSLNGVNLYTGATTVSAGALSGTGTIAGSLAVNAGGTLNPGVGGSNTLTVAGAVTLASGSTNTFSVDGTALINNSVALGSTVAYGGVLNIITNGSFTAGQNFTLFSGVGAAQPSNFGSIVGSPGAGLGFTFTNGVLSVVSAGPPQPTILPVTVSGTNLVVSVPTTSGYNYVLQSATNLTPTILWKNESTNAGTGGNLILDVPVDPAKPQKFLRFWVY